MLDFWPSMQRLRALLLCFCVMSHVLCLGPAVLASDAPSADLLNDVTIVVSSCDKYRALWPGFFHCLFRYWPQLETQHTKTPIVLIAGKETFTHPRVQVFQTGEDKGWSQNLLDVLAEVKTRYVLYLQEDYFLCAPVLEEKVFSTLTLMNKSSQIVYCQFNEDAVFGRPEHPHVNQVFCAREGLLQKALCARYRNSLQAALWRTETLKNLLNPSETPWQFESEGNKRSVVMEKETGATFLIFQHPAPFVYLNALQRGQLERVVVAWIRKEAVPFPKKNPFPVRNTPYMRRLYEPHAVDVLKKASCLTQEDLESLQSKKKRKRFFNVLVDYFVKIGKNLA